MFKIISGKEYQEYVGLVERVTAEEDQAEVIEQLQNKNAELEVALTAKSGIIASLQSQVENQKEMLQVREAQHIAYAEEHQLLVTELTNLQSYLADMSERLLNTDL